MKTFKQYIVESVKDDMLMKALKIVNTNKKYGHGIKKWSINEFLYEIGSPLQWNTKTHQLPYANDMMKVANKFLDTQFAEKLQNSDINHMVDSILKWSGE